MNLGLAVRMVKFDGTFNIPTPMRNRRCTVNFCKLVECPHLYQIRVKTSVRNMCSFHDKQISKMKLSKTPCQLESIDGREES